MQTRKATVDQAILFRNPPRIPVWVDGDHLKYSDVLTYDLCMPQEDDPELSEWGFRRIKLPNGQWGIPTESTLPEWKDVDFYQVPDLDPVRRLSGIAKAATICEDRYRMASFGMSGFSIYCSLRGAELSSVDFLIEPDRFIELMEFIFEFEVGIFDLLARKGFHAIEFCDDWGPRGVSKVTLSLWQRMLKTHYAKAFKRAKESGLHIWFSTSSESAEFFGDLKEIGADVIRLETPYSMELAEIGRQYRGKICFAVRLDEVVTGQPETDDIVEHLYECLAGPEGGFIATIADNVPDSKSKQIVDLLKKIDKKNAVN